MESAQAKYEAALGTFLVRFNRLEQATTWLIEQAFRTAGMEALGLKLGGESFSRKLETLTLIGRDNVAYRHNVETRLKKIAQARNKLAHADVDLSPLIETFRVLLNKEHPVDPVMLPELIDEADNLGEILIQMLTDITLADGEFANIPILPVDRP